MSERFPISERPTKEQERAEIEEGLADFLKLGSFDSPRSEEGTHPELTNDFNVFRAEKPLKRSDVEQDVEGFISKNMATLLPILLDPSLDDSTIIEQLGITNEHLGLWGANYYIKSVNGRPKIRNSDDPNGWDNSHHYWEKDLIALAYAKANIRVDTAGGGTHGAPPHRYYSRSHGRYLCANDFGMRIWSEQDEAMIEGDSTNLQPYIQTIASQVKKIINNIQEVETSLFNEIVDELRSKTQQELGVEYLNAQQDQAIITDSEKQARQEILTMLSTDSKEKKLVLTAIPTQKVTSHIYFHPDKIATKYGFISDNPIADYQNFAHNAENLQNLFRMPSEEEKTDTRLAYFYYDFYDKPVLLPAYDIETFVNIAKKVLVKCWP